MNRPVPSRQHKLDRTDSLFYFDPLTLLTGEPHREAIKQQGRPHDGRHPKQKHPSDVRGLVNQA